ncbi:MAG: hypothetical protein AAFN92_12260, partial [Bacteroidota bacterium]
YFNADLSVRWQRNVTKVNDQEEIGALAFVNADSLFMSLVSDTTATTIVSFTPDGGVTTAFSVGTDAETKIWDIEIQSDGTLLLGGQESSFSSTIIKTTVTGDTIWVSDINNYGIDYVSGVHRVPGENIIAATGAGFRDRSLVAMDTLGEVREFNRYDDSFIFEPQEQVRWFDETLELFADYSPEGTFFRGTFSSAYTPGFTFDEGEGSAQGLTLYGSEYDVDRGIIHSAVASFFPTRRILILRFNPSQFTLETTALGEIPFDANERGVGIVALPESGFLLLGDGPGPGGLPTPIALSTDAFGEQTSRKVVGLGTTDNGAPAFTMTPSGHFLAANRLSNGLGIAKFNLAGDTLFQRTIPSTGIPLDAKLASLPDGGMVLLDNVRTLTSSTSPSLLILDSLANVQSSIVDSSGIVFIDFLHPGTTGDIIISGRAFSRDTAFIINFDVATGNTNWIVARAFEDYQRNRFVDMITLPDGTYGALMVPFSNDTLGRRLNLFYVHFDADGNELSQTELPTDSYFLNRPNMNVNEAGIVSVVYSLGFVENDDVDNPTNIVRLVRLDASTKEITLEADFASPFRFTDPGQVIDLPDGKGAIIGTSSASDTSNSTDMLLLVFDEEGTITDLRPISESPWRVTLNPNPTSDFANISFDESRKVSSMTLISAAGRQLLHRNIGGRTSVTVDL